MTPIERARASVAARHQQPYHKAAIMAGEWDAGEIVRREVAEIEAAMKLEETNDE